MAQGREERGTFAIRSWWCISYTRPSARTTKSSTRFCGVERSTSHMNRAFDFVVSQRQSVGTGKSTSSRVRSWRTISMHPVFDAKNSYEAAVRQISPTEPE